MSTAALAPPAPVPPLAPATPAPAVQRTRHRFSVDEYYRMGELGLFVGKPRVELIDGEIVEVMPNNPPHDGTVDRLRELLGALVPPGWRPRIQLSLGLSSSSPLPDACIVSGDWRTFLTRHPVPADVGLLIEVADSSLLDDRRDKGRLYAYDGIAEYWIVNVPERQIEVYTQPSGPSPTPGYAHRVDYLPGASVPLVLGGVAVGVIGVSELLG